MTDFFKESKKLQENKLLLSSRDFTKVKYTAIYSNVGSLWTNAALPVITPIANAFLSIVWASSAAWAALRTVGNLLIMKPNLALNAFDDFGARFVLSIAMALMAPVNLILGTITLLTRLVSTWFKLPSIIASERLKAEPMDINSGQTAPKTFLEKLVNESSTQVKNDLLPSEKYINSAKFFTPIKSVTDLLGTVLSPVGMPIRGAVNSAVKGVQTAYELLICVSNLLICKPKHAGDSLRNAGAHLTLSLALAAMIPVNALIEALIVMTRLGSTWKAAITDGNDYPMSAARI